MNHDRLTLYYRSTISHFLLDLLNPTGTGVGAAAPLTTWLQQKKAGFGRTKTRQSQCRLLQRDLGSKITDNTHAKQVHNTPFVPCFVDKVHCTAPINLEVK